MIALHMWCWGKGRWDKRREGKKEDWGSGERREGEKIEREGVCRGKNNEVKRIESVIEKKEQLTDVVCCLN